MTKRVADGANNNQPLRVEGGRRLPAKRAADGEMGKDDAGAGEDDAVVFFVLVVVENNEVGISLSMSSETAAAAIVVDVVVVVVVVHILDGQCNCPAASKEEGGGG